MELIQLVVTCQIELMITGFQSSDLTRDLSVSSELWNFIYLFLLCRRRTLAQYLGKLEKDMEERDILIIFQQMLSALKYIHGNNILHRLD